MRYNKSLIFFVMLIISLTSASAVLMGNINASNQYNVVRQTFPNYDAQISSINNNILSLQNQINTIVIGSQYLNQTYANTLYYNINNPNLFINATYGFTLFANINNSANLSFNETRTNLLYMPINLSEHHMLDYNVTTNYIPVKDGGNIYINSPIKSFNNGVENITTFYDSNLYIDNTHAMVGVNVVAGSESHQQAFVVTSLRINGSGNMNSTGTQNLTTNTTIFVTSNSIPTGLTDASTIFFNNSNYYVFSIIDSTHLSLRGLYTTSTKFSSYQYQQAPYIDVNGASNMERGYTISSNGTWIWSMYVSDHSNDTELCFQNRVAWFGNTTDALCIEQDGDININGKLLSDSYYTEFYNTSNTTLTMTTQNVFYNITNNSLGLTSGFSNGDGINLYCNQSGLFTIHYGINAEVNNNDVLLFRIMVNGVSDAKSENYIRYSNGLPIKFADTFYRRLNSGDTIRLEVADQTRNGAILTMYDRNINVQMVAR